MCLAAVVFVVAMQIFGCILSVRSNDNYQIGFQYEDTVTYTPFYVCRQSGRASDQESKASPMLLDYRSTFAAVLACLEKVLCLYGSMCLVGSYIMFCHKMTLRF